MKHISNLFLLFVTTFATISSSFAQSGWVSQSSGTTNLLIGVFFTDASTGTAVGGNPGSSIILHTTNGGATWTGQSSGTTNPLQGVSFTDASTGTAVGAGGTILHTTTGGITWVHEDLSGQIPSTFVLEQNYPNPFNPSTWIQFYSPHPSDAEVVIYNALGERIKTLFFSGGAHEGVNGKEWNGLDEQGKRVPSGVYFYQLRTSTFSDTKRMLLIK